LSFSAKDSIFGTACYFLVDGAIDFTSEAGGKLLISQGRVKLKAEAALRSGNPMISWGEYLQ